MKDVGNNLGGYVLTFDYMQLIVYAVRFAIDGLDIKFEITRIFELQTKLYETGTCNYMLNAYP